MAADAPSLADRAGSLATKARRKGGNASRKARGAVVSRLRGQGGLSARVTELEADAAECRRLHQRVAELTDIVQELLIPLAQRDDARVQELLAQYADSL